jgi:hypothetical protein
MDGFIGWQYPSTGGELSYGKQTDKYNSWSPCLYSDLERRHTLSVLEQRTFRFWIYRTTGSLDTFFSDHSLHEFYSSAYLQYTC